MELIGRLGYYQLKAAVDEPAMRAARELVEFALPHMQEPQLKLGIAEAELRLGRRHAAAGGPRAICCARSGRWSEPAQGFLRIHARTAELPDGLDQLLAAERSGANSPAATAVTTTCSPCRQAAARRPGLHILLSNLIGNAFAHAEDGAVEIGSAHGRLHIVNRAAALDTAAAQRLVEEPYAKREGSAGFGLGLVIVRRLGERFGLDLRISLDDGAARASSRLVPGADLGETGMP